MLPIRVRAEGEMEQSTQNVGDFCLQLEGALGRGSGSAERALNLESGDSDSGSGASQGSHLEQFMWPLWLQTGGHQPSIISSLCE